MKTTVFQVFIIFCVFISDAVTAKPRISGKEADSLFRVLDHNPDDSATFNRLDQLINELLYKDIDRAILVSVKTHQYAINAGNKPAEVQSVLNTGIAYDLKGNYTKALERYGEALRLAMRYKLRLMEGDIYNNFSITNAVLGNIEESVATALKALAIFESAGDSTRMARIYNNLGSRYSEMGYNDEALKYYNKAALINEKVKDYKKLAFNYGNIGLIYYGQDKFSDALTYFIKSIQLQDTIHDKFNFSIALHNLALAYQGLKQYEKALSYEKRALAYSNEINDELGRITSMNGMAAIMNDMGRKREALSLYLESQALAEKIGARYYLIHTYENIARLYAQFHEYQKAFDYNQKYAGLKDSIMSKEKDKAVQKIKNYENNKTRQEIRILTKDAEIQRLKIKRQKIIRNSIASVGFLLLLLAIGLMHRYRYMRRTRNELSRKNTIINQEKERSDELLLNILPAETAAELKRSGRSEARHYAMVTVMFADFKGFTYLAEQLSPQQLVDEIDVRFRKFDEIIARHGIEKIKTIGDAYMCAGGLPVANTSNPVDVVSAACEIIQFMNSKVIEQRENGLPVIELRIGIHTGPVVAGIVGTRKFQYDIWGDTVNLASRMESSGEAGKINISSATYELVRDHFSCSYRGKIKAKNKGEIDMYFVGCPEQT